MKCHLSTFKRDKRAWSEALNKDVKKIEQIEDFAEELGLELPQSSKRKGEDEAELPEKKKKKKKKTQSSYLDDL